MSVSKETANRKRKLENDEAEKEEDNSKRISLAKLELLDFADELLMEIAKKLDGESLHNVSLTCSRLKNLILDKRLWTEAIFATKDLDIWEIFKRLKYMTVNTKRFKITGNAKKEEMDRRPLKNRQTFKEIIKRVNLRSPLIEHLHFDKLWFDWTLDFTITKFPANLRSLVFTNCLLPKDRNRMSRTFTNIFDRMPNLEELRLEYCNFFEANDLMPLSKLQELKILSLRGCKRFRNCVPYISLSCRFGFKKLEVLDLRETNISDSEVQCLNALKTLKELYLEYPDTEPALSEDDSDDEFHHFYRAYRRPSRRQSNENSTAEEPATSSNNAGPSTSSAANLPEPAQAENEDSLSSNPSSPESLSDSIPSPSSANADAEPFGRTIYIQANITENPNQNARLQVFISDDVPHASRFLQLARNREQRRPLSVSDRGMLSFGVPRTSLVGNVVFLGNQQQPDANTYLERIVLRNFSNITDTTLSHLQTNAPRLVFLDIRGCDQITREATERFKLTRGNCQLLSNFDLEFEE